MVEFFTEMPNSRFVREELKNIVEAIPGLQRAHEDVMDGGKRAFLDFRRRMAPLEAFVKDFAGSNSDESYKTSIRDLEKLERELKAFKPSDETVSLGKAALEQDCGQLIRDLRNRGRECLSDMLEQKFQASMEQDKEKAEAQEKYKTALDKFCLDVLMPFTRQGSRSPSRAKLRDEDEARRYQKEFSDVIFSKEKDAWEKNELSWSSFTLQDATQEKVAKYITKKMDRLPAIS